MPPILTLLATAIICISKPILAFDQQHYGIEARQFFNEETFDLLDTRDILEDDIYSLYARDGFEDELDTFHARGFGDDNEYEGYSLHVRDAYALGYADALEVRGLGDAVAAKMGDAKDKAATKMGDFVAGKCEDRVMETKNKMLNSNMQDPSVGIPLLQEWLKRADQFTKCPGVGQEGRDNIARFKPDKERQLADLLNKQAGPKRRWYFDD